MLATRELPAGFSEWNRRWGAPLGRRVGTGRLDETRLHVRALRVLESRTTARIRFCGPFAWQWNSALRQFEYPWVSSRCRRSSTWPLPTSRNWLSTRGGS